MDSLGNDSYGKRLAGLIVVALVLTLLSWMSLTATVATIDSPVVLTAFAVGSLSTLFAIAAFVIFFSRVREDKDAPSQGLPPKRRFIALAVAVAFGCGLYLIGVSGVTGNQALFLSLWWVLPALIAPASLIVQNRQYINIFGWACIGLLLLGLILANVF
ncbi:hypothetical protein VCB98_01505 [Gammaproteobacteria bacterium AB-CW1]|uniref:Uncharacterized protein n=1 Tax=Natronospira elongata TaxID=3110268 RepID=A0AAP6MKP2_9GAMM|nr:hypothetical protein [Gammaproteobacteria bacterium AB-CW1]